MKHHFIVILSLFIASVAFPVQADDEIYGKSGIDGYGETDIEQLPEALRVSVLVQSQAATIKGALAGLKHRVGATKKKLVSAGAKEASIVVERAQISDGTGTQQKQMAMMVARRLRAMAKKGENAPKAQLITVVSTVTAEFPLSSKDYEALLVEAHALQESIKAANVGGADAAGELTPEQKELQEELAQQGMDLDSLTEGQPKPGEPVFLFVAKIPDAVQSKAITDACQKARADAVKTAKATGVELGALKLVASGIANSDDSNYSSLTGYQAALIRAQSGSGHKNKGEPFEASSPKPGMLKCNVSVSLGYSLGK